MEISIDEVVKGLKMYLEYHDLTLTVYEKSVLTRALNIIEEIDNSQPAEE